MTESIIINSSQETEYNIRPITNLYEFEYGLFSEKFNVYFNDKTDISNPFLASVEITNSLGQKRWINYKPYTDQEVTLGYVDKNKILYSNVFAPNVDVEYEILNGQLKENIILNSPTPLRQFEFTLKLSEFVEYELNDTGDIIFTDTITTEELWKIPSPNMIDANGNESRNLYYSFENRDEYLSIIVNVNDNDFLDSATYPIYIDPTTVYDDSVLAIGFGKTTTARDNFGNLYIVFNRAVSSYQRIMIRRILTNNTIQYWNGSAFVSSGGTETRIDTNSGNYNQTAPSIAIDSLNNIHIVWTGRSTGINADQVCYRKATYNSGNDTYSFNAQVQISTGIDTKMQFSPHIAIDGLNNIHIVWNGQDNTNTVDQIKYRRYKNSDSTWTTWENINVISSKAQAVPHIAIDSQNNVHLVYYGADATYTYNQVKYSKLLYNSGNWGNWTNDTGTDVYNNISPIDGYTQSIPFITIDNNDKLHVVWHGLDASYTQNQIKYSYFNGSSWSGWVNIQPTMPNRNQLNPNIIVDNSNNLYVVWQGYDDTNTAKFQIKYSKNIYNGSTWNGWISWTNLTDGASNTVQFDNPKLSYNNNQMDLTYHNNNTWTLLYENITPVPPATPTLLRATIQSSSRILWEWNDNSSDEVNFKLKNTSGNLITTNLFLSDGVTPISNGLIPPNTTSIIEKGLAANTPYTRRIVAANDNGDSPYDEESATTRALPTFNTFTGTKNGLNNLTWTINKT